MNLRITVAGQIIQFLYCLSRQQRFHTTHFIFFLNAYLAASYLSPFILLAAARQP